MNVKANTAKPNNPTRKYCDNNSLFITGVFAATLVTTGTLDQTSPLIALFSITSAFLIIKLNIINAFVDIREKQKKALMENYTFAF